MHDRPAASEALEDARPGLRTDELLHRLAADIRDASILLLDPDGRIASWNVGAERLCGFRGHDVLGRPYAHLHVDEDVRAGVPQRALAAALAQGSVRDEGWRLRRDGSRFLAEIVVSALVAPSGELEGFGVVTWDRTDHPGLEGEGDVDLLEGVLRTAPGIGVVATDAAGTITAWNAGAERLLGIRAEAAVGRRNIVSVPEAGELAAAAAVLRIPPGPELMVATGPRTWRCVHGDGAAVQAEIAVAPVHGADGATSGYLVLATPATAERLPEQPGLLREAFGVATSGLAVVSAGPRAPGTVLEANPALCRMLALRRDELLGQPLSRFVHPAEVEAHDHLVRDLATHADEHRADRRLLVAGGGVVDTDLTVSAVRGPDGSLQRVVVAVHDIGARKRYESRLRHLADHDSLTGLPNRTRLDEALDLHVAWLGRHEPCGALLMLDLDGFKEVNDRFGHHAGDRVLISVGHALSSRVRDTDVLARLGGDEFVVLMDDGGLEEAKHLARDLAELVRSCTELPAEDDVPQITASIGIAVFDGRDGVGAEEVLAECDAAMYAAKAKGRGGIEAFVPRHRLPSGRFGRTTWQQRIDAALRDDRFEVLLQPVLDLRAGGVDRYEALLRMTDTEGRRIEPAAFLHVAERFDQMPAIDLWVIDHVAAMVARLPGGRSVEVNLSGRTLRDPALAGQIAGAITDHGVAPERLVFEITEAVAGSDLARAREFAEELQTLGCRFALDHFGAGLGSFYALRHLPVEFLKLDGGLVAACAGDDADRLIVSTCVQLARGLGKRTVAEGVERPDVLRAVRTLGVDFAQGRQIGWPATIAEVLA